MLQKILPKSENLFLILSAFLFAGGIFTTFREALADNSFVLMRQTTEIFLFFNYLALSIFLLKSNLKFNFVIWFVSTWFLTVLIEIVGVKTGLVFGQYEYGQTLVLQFLEVPILIGLCWVIVVFSAMQIAQKFTQNSWLQIFIAGLIGLIVDIIIEPIAIALDYWRWPENNVPLQNYIAWFVITIIFASLYKYLKIEIDSTIARYFFIIQTIFLTSVNLIIFFI